MGGSNETQELPPTTEKPSSRGNTKYMRDTSPLLRYPSYIFSKVPIPPSESDQTWIFTQSSKENTYGTNLFNNNFSRSLSSHACFIFYWIFQVFMSFVQPKIPSRGTCQIYCIYYIIQSILALC